MQSLKAEQFFNFLFEMFERLYRKLGVYVMKYFVFASLFFFSKHFKFLYCIVYDKMISFYLMASPNQPQHSYQ